MRKNDTLKHELNPVPSKKICNPSSIMPKISNFHKPPTKGDSTIPDEIYFKK